MKLASFPHLVQKEILDHLSINNLFFLSLCSKNTKNFITRTEKCQLEKVERVTYWSKERFLMIEVKTVSTKIPQMMCLVNANNGFEEYERNVEEVRVDVLGTSIDFFRYPNNRSDLHAKYTCDNVELIIGAIHNHLYDLLGHQIKFWLSSNFQETYFLPMLPNIQMLDILGDGTEPTKIDELLSRSTCLEYLSWSTFNKLNIRLTENSRIFDLDTVYMLSDCLLVTDALKHFNGRQTFLRGNSIKAAHVIQFLNAWKSTEKFQNLEVISVKSSAEIAEIQNSVEFKEVGGEVEYSFIRGFLNPYQRGNDPSEFKSNLYLVRESNGHVASVMLTGDLIMIGVWNMTEKEFLKKFQ